MSQESVYDSRDSKPAGLEELVVLRGYTDLLQNLVLRDLRVRYKRSVLGFLWTMLNPLLMMIVFTIVFSTVFRFAIDNFIVYFLSAYLLWTFFSQSTLAALTSIVGNADLIKKIYVPKSVFVLSNVVSGLINFLFALVPLTIVVVLTGPRIDRSWLILPVPVILTAVFALGVSLLVSAVVVFFYDVVEMYQVVLVAWMYLTPIFYPLDIIPHPFRKIIQLNPMYYLTECFRLPLHSGTLPPVTYLAYSSLAASLAFVIGWWVFSRATDRFAYYI